MHLNLDLCNPRMVKEQSSDYSFEQHSSHHLLPLSEATELAILPSTVVDTDLTAYVIGHDT